MSTGSSSAGGIFGIVWLVVWMPIYLIGAGWFWHRREIQPIKARSPYLVLVCDCILILYVLVSCLQRILGDAYPCYLNLWASYIGTLVLLNTYLIRCWHLYFKYFLTQEKLKVTSFDENSTFFVRHRRYIDVSFVSKVLSLIGLLLLIPPAVLSSTNRDNLTNNGGEECDKAWGDAVLACYVGGYILVFIGFGWNLRQVVDGFMIKEELRFTAVVGVATVIPWFIFNNIFRSVNTDIFPFSTFIIVVAVTIQLVASTGWPLYRSIYQPLALEDLHVPDDIATLRGLLSDPDGFASFKNFLSHEFSVENILFWKEVEDFRAKKLKNLGSLELLGEAQSIYAKYIIRGAPFEVNLPSAIVVDLQKRLKEEYGGLAAVNRSISRVEFPSSTSTSKDNEPLVEAEPEKVPTIFDSAQRNIFHLMETDSYQRYIASSEYAQLTQQYMQRARKKEVLLEMQVI